jgi:hypothetical protein
VLSVFPSCLLSWYSVQEAGGEGDEDERIATYILQFMWQSAVKRFSFPLAYFRTRSAAAHDLQVRLWLLFSNPPPKHSLLGSARSNTSLMAAVCWRIMGCTSCT